MTSKKPKPNRLVDVRAAKKRRLAKLKLEQERSQAEVEGKVGSSPASQPDPSPQTPKEGTAAGPERKPVRSLTNGDRPQTVKSSVTATATTSPVRITVPSGDNSTRNRPTSDFANVSIADSAEELEAESETPRRWNVVAFIHSTPAWLASMVLHVVIILVMSLFTLAAIKEDVKHVLVASQADEEMEISEVEFEPLEEMELEDVPIPSSEIDPGQIDFGDISSVSEQTTTDAIGDIAIAESTMGEIGELFGDNGAGMSDIGEGLKEAAQFFGAKAAGNRFAFVVDNSNSMTKGRFETALIEIVKAIDKLGPKQYFYVVFYSDTAYPLFYPTPANGMVPATNANKQKLRYWLDTVQMCLRTNCEPAMRLALMQKPDVLFLLGDGALDKTTAKILVSKPVPNVVIHLLGMQVNKGEAAQFAAIAKAHRGTYRDVGVTPQGLAMMKQMGPRPRNDVRKGIWGIKLDNNKKKKKK